MLDSAPTPAEIQKEQLLKDGNLTEQAIQVLGSRMRIRRNPTVGTEKEDTNNSNANNIGDIYDGEIDINFNYTGFLEIIGKLNI